MKILFLLGDDAPHSAERQLAERAETLLKRDAEIVWADETSPLSAYGEPDGVWIFTHEEDGGCPKPLLARLEVAFPAYEDIPAAATGIGGKEGAMNAITEIIELFGEKNGRLLRDSEPLCIPLRSAKFDLDQDEKMELFFLADEFLKYCGMDDSESRKIGFETVVADYFKLLKYLSADDRKPAELKLEGERAVTDVGTFGWEDLEEAPEEIRDLPHEIETLVSDYEIEDEEIAPALLEKIKRDW